MANLGKFLRDIRGARSLSELSQIIDVDKGYLSKIERNERRPKPDMLEKISRAYGVEYNRLLIMCGYAETDEDADLTNKFISILYKKTQEMEILWHPIYKYTDLPTFRSKYIDEFFQLDTARSYFCFTDNGIILLIHLFTESGESGEFSESFELYTQTSSGHIHLASGFELLSSIEKYISESTSVQSASSYMSAFIESYDDNMDCDIDAESASMSGTDQEKSQQS